MLCLPAAPRAGVRAMRAGVRRRPDARACMRAQVLPPASSTLRFMQFLEGLRHVACMLRCTLNELMEKVVLLQSPA